jgi:hypothetical protein
MSEKDCNDCQTEMCATCQIGARSTAFFQARLDAWIAQERACRLAEGYMAPDGTPTTLEDLVESDPRWACSVIRLLKAKNAAAEEALEGMTAHARRWEDKAEEYRTHALKLLDKRNDGHCQDCCCAQAWAALGVTEYTGESIPDYIKKTVAERDAARAALERERDIASERLHMIDQAHAVLTNANWPEFDEHEVRIPLYVRVIMAMAPPAGAGNKGEGAP